MLIRAIRADDRGRLIAAFRKLEPETIYTRFFEYKNELTDADLKRATEVDFEKRVVLLVTTGSGADEIVIGGGSYASYGRPDGGRSAEVAFIVEEEYQGFGLGSRLLRHLAAIAGEGHRPLRSGGAPAEPRHARSVRARRADAGAQGRRRHPGDAGA